MIIIKVKIIIIIIIIISCPLRNPNSYNRSWDKIQLACRFNRFARLEIVKLPWKVPRYTKTTRAAEYFILTFRYYYRDWKTSIIRQRISKISYLFAFYPWSIGQIHIENLSSFEERLIQFSCLVYIYFKFCNLNSFLYGFCSLLWIILIILLFVFFSSYPIGLLGSIVFYINYVDQSVQILWFFLSSCLSLVWIS